LPPVESTLFAAIIITITSFSLALVRGWRTNIIFLAIQYVGVFILVSGSWSFSMAIIILLAGWIASTVLGMAMVSLRELQPGLQIRTPLTRISLQQMLVSFLHLFSERAFYLLAGLLILVVIGSQIPLMFVAMPGISAQNAWSGLVLIGFGLLKTGFTDQPFHTTIGILSFLAGFEILYATIQSSLLMAGLLAGVTLALSIIGAYLLLCAELEPSV
jgi:hypothetical protein